MNSGCDVDRIISPDRGYWDRTLRLPATGVVGHGNDAQRNVLRTFFRGINFSNASTSMLPLNGAM